MSGGSFQRSGSAFSAAVINGIGRFRQRAPDRWRGLACLGLLAALFTCPLAAAAVLRAGPDCPYATPQLAFGAARNGDTVRIRSGNYAGPFVLGWAITVEGGYDNCINSQRSGRSDFHGAAPSQSADSLLTVAGSTGHVVLDRITLRDNNKSTGDGAGLYVDRNSSVAFSEIEIRNNWALNGNGGGIYVVGSDGANNQFNTFVELVENGTVLIESNRANNGGGIALNGAQARVLFDLGAVGAAASFRNNKVNTNGGLGSALYLFNGSDANLIDSLIEIDSGQTAGAVSAVEIADSPALSGLTLDNATLSFNGNTPYPAIGARGGNARITGIDTLIEGWLTGLILRDGTAQLDRVSFHSNHGNTSNTPNPSFGGGIRLLGNAALVGHSLEFIDNVARNGGAMAVLENASWSLFGAPGLPTRFIGNRASHATDGRGGAIYHESAGTGSINDSPTDWGLVEFRGNQAQPFGAGGLFEGGAIYVDSAAIPQLTLRSPLVFANNTARTDGGAININRGHLSLDARIGEQIEFVDNSSTNGDGGAIRRGGDGSRLLINRDPGNHGAVMLVGNAASDRGGSLAVFGVGELRIQAPVRFLNSAQARTANYGGQIYAIGAGDQSAIVELQGWAGNGRGILIAGGYAGYDGGGMYLSGVTATLDWVQFGTPDQPNRVFSGEGTHLTAYLSGTDVKLRNCSLRHGHSVTGSDNHGLLVDVGAIVRMESVFGVAGTPPAIGAAWPCEAAILGYEAHCSDISDNGNLNQFGQGSIGGGVSIGNAAQLILNGVSIDRNLGAPGAIEVESGGSLIAKNVRVSDNSSGVRLAGTAQMVAEHLTVAGNTGIAFELADAPGTTLDLVRSIVWGNATGIVKGAQAVISADCNISQTAAFGTSSDPGFVDSDRGRYRIGNGAALDHCPGSSASEDLDGSPRPQGSDYDAGALEGLSLPRPTLLFFDGFE